MSLSPYETLGIIAGYFVLLIIVARITSRKGIDSQDFFIAGKQSPWYIVAFGMIGASLSGVTFISIPGNVGDTGANMAYSYMQMVFGYLVGYLIIATVLMPIYYRIGSVSIYEYLRRRFGSNSHLVGSSYFILSRVIGASFRLFLVALVLHSFVMQPLGLSFPITVILCLALIYSYTFKGGLRTIIWTDTLQTTFMLSAVIATIIYILSSMDISLTQLPTTIREAGYNQMFFFENGWSDPNNFYKQFISGALIALVMTGLDQDMMQKNLSCRTLKEAQWNVGLFSTILVVVNLAFLTLGAMLYIYANHHHIAIPEATDKLYGLLAFEHFPKGIAILFILGLVAAAYSSADSALTALTTSFCVDILKQEHSSARQRTMVHIGFAILLAIVIIVFHKFLDQSAIVGLFKAAGYTYGPLLGLFSFGILTKRAIHDNLVWIVCLIAPIASYILNANSQTWFGGLSFGFMIIAINGLLTFLGLLIISKPADRDRATI